MKGLRKSKAAFSVKAVPDKDLEIIKGWASPHKKIFQFCLKMGGGGGGGPPPPPPPVLSPRSATVKIVYK